MNVNADRQAGQYVEQQILHVASALQDMTRIDEKKISGTKRSEHIQRYGLKSVLDHRHVASVRRTQHKIKPRRVRFDKCDFGSDREKSLYSVQNYTRRKAGTHFYDL